MTVYINGQKTAHSFLEKNLIQSKPNNKNFISESLEYAYRLP